VSKPKASDIYIGETLPDPEVAPTVGEHNERVLREVLGYDAEKIQKLRDAGTFG
jgi:crotonobetainyl-CoA:carnitine CoA-transferase CaiB-like acyl-CoA transferase